VRAPADVASQLGIAEGDSRRLGASSSQVLAGLKHEVVRYADSVSARMPDPIEVGFFRSPGIVPVLVVSRTAYDRRRPVRLSRTSSGPTRFGS
jgi:UTRA domain